MRSCIHQSQEVPESPMRRPRIIIVGSINMDLVYRTHQLPRPGETISGHSFRQIPGGKGANQAVAAARLGADVSMVGRVGDDGFAKVFNLTVCPACALLRLLLELGLEMIGPFSSFTTPIEEDLLRRKARARQVTQHLRQKLEK